MNNENPENPNTTRRTTRSESQTIGPQGARSGRSSPPPLYPDPNMIIPPQAGGIPERVDEIDLNATRVSPAALNIQATTRSREKPPRGLPPFRRFVPGWGCWMRGVVISLFVGAGLLIIAAIAAVLMYASIAADLPSVDDLRNRSAQFETTRILDREGHELYQILDPQRRAADVRQTQRHLTLPDRRNHRHRRQRVLQPPRLRPGGDHPGTLAKPDRRRDQVGRIHHYPTRLL